MTEDKLLNPCYCRVLLDFCDADLNLYWRIIINDFDKSRQEYHMRAETKTPPSIGIKAPVIHELAEEAR